MIWTPKTEYVLEPFETEAQLEAVIAEVSPILFGPARIYLDVKKLIGAKGKTKNIPDGYLIDLASKKEPRLFVVENELASHEPLKHVAVQVLEFSLSFETAPFKLKAILKDALKTLPSALKQCEDYAHANGFENLDYLLEKMIQKTNAFNALVIIDDLDEELGTVLHSRFRFPVEILTIRRFCSKIGERAYDFDPFLADLSTTPIEPGQKSKTTDSTIDPSELDTIVVPAQEDGFQETFINENRWYAIRIHSTMLSKIKYIAAYRVAPISAITHIASVKSIVAWQDSNKYLLDFVEPAKEITPIKLLPKPHGLVKAPQGPRYASYEHLMKATNLDEAF